MPLTEMETPVDPEVALRLRICGDALVR